jgi:NADH-quinone oxidoreductase subunit G
LLGAMYVRNNGELKPVAIDEAARRVDQGLKEICQGGGIVAGVLSPFLTVEEAYLVSSYLKELNPANVLALGPIPASGADQTFRPDQTTGRSGDTSFIVPRPFTLHAEKCPNRRGVSAVLEHFEGKVTGHDELLRRVAAGEFQGLYVVSDAIDPWIKEGESEALRSKLRFLVVQDTNVTPLAHRADVVLAGATFAEKAGCYVNADGRLQYSEAALPPRDGSLPDLDLLAILMHRPGGGPVDSSLVLAEIAERIPAFGVAKGGKLPAFGAVLGATSPPDGRGGGSFTDSWFLAHGVARGR